MKRILLYSILLITWIHYVQTQTDSVEAVFKNAKLYFVEEYKNNKEIGKSDVFYIGPNGGYLTVMLDLRSTGTNIGASKINLKIYKIVIDEEQIMDTRSFDVQSYWDYIYFDKFYTFKSEGRYKVVAVKTDGTQIAQGGLSIFFK